MEQPPQRPTVLVLRRISARFEEALSKGFHLLKPWEAEDGVEAESGQASGAFLARHADSVRAVLCSDPGTRVEGRVMALLPRLECVVSTSMGLNNVDVAECRRRGVAVANAGSVFCEDTADHAVGLLIDVLRRVSAGDRYVRSGRWPQQGDFPLGSKLGGKRVGIVGLGKIGSEIAGRLQAFGCVILYHARTRKTYVPYAYSPSVLDLAKQSDVLVVACELTDETHHIINKDVLSALGKHGVVINIGRGRLVDEKALVRCLIQGEIGGAGLDVFENEPDVPAELRLMDNVVLSPHKAFLSQKSLSDIIQLTVQNLEAFFSNRPLLSPVT
uniref:Glyoxylate reductase n=1 Tax=Anthurium amnicola TaxID=1678845 RepID=A0A1D1Z174_9ARAE